MTKSKIEIEDLAKAYRNSDDSNISGYQYFPYAIQIMALRSLGVRHRMIADLLNRKINSKNALTSNYLATIISRWKVAGLLDGKESEIRKMAESIKLASNLQDDVSNIIEKMNSLEKKVDESTMSYIRNEIEKLKNKERES